MAGVRLADVTEAISAHYDVEVMGQCQLREHRLGRCFRLVRTYTKPEAAAGQFGQSLGHAGVGFSLC